MQRVAASGAGGVPLLGRRYGTAWCPVKGSHHEMAGEKRGGRAAAAGSVFGEARTMQGRIGGGGRLKGRWMGGGPASTSSDALRWF